MGQQRFGSSGWGRWLAIGLSVGMGTGCLQFDPFQCQDDADCVYNGRPGQCRLAEQTCIYPDDACPTRWSAANGECMSAAGAVSESEASDGVASDDATSGTSNESATSSPTETDTATATATTTTTTGPTTTTTTTGNPVGCGEGPFEDMTGVGVVEASSIFGDNFHAFLAADGDLGSSWFSSGPESGGPSIYMWTVLNPRCIATVSVIGNGLHDNASYREGFGFENMVVRIYDENDALVFQQMDSLAGTPDPPVVVAPHVWGVRIELELSEHESSDCGGFSELAITGI